MMEAAWVFQLTSEQRAVVELPVEARILVTAGPGTGKTHTMTARIYHLVNELDVAPGAEILVLTFTRAAVREIRKRCRDVGGRLNYILASTFDSFGSRLLRHFRPDALGTWGSYDERIRAATKLIETDEEARSWLSRYRHVFVDEVQDLVGVRSSFVKAVLEHSGAGFSLFGDPAQSIYNFQLTGKDRELGSREFFQWVADRFPHLMRCTLTVNHRARSTMARTVLDYGRVLGSENVDHEEVYRNLVATIDTYEPSISVKELGRFIPSLLGSGTVAVLGRTNGECLDVSETLWEQGIAHTVRRRAEDRYIPKWVALAFRGFTGVDIRAKALKQRLLTARVSDPDMVYDSLRRLTGGSASGLRVPDLRERLQWGLFPDELEPVDEENVVVSTIHRAKGLEFSTVLFLWDSSWSEQEYPGEEARVLYVALTRPVRNLVRVRFERWPGLLYDDRLERWIVKRYGWQLRRVEVNTSDVSVDIPPGALASSSAERVDVQTYLSDHVRPGDEVTLVNADQEGRLPHLCFYIEHRGKVVGTTNEGFSRILRRAIRGDWRPGRIHNLRIVGVRTVVGDPSITMRAGLGNHGFWLVPEISGMGILGN